MREAVPGPYLREWLERLAMEMPPLPHAALNINWKAVGKPRKQGTRMLKAECAKMVETDDPQPCGYTIRLSAKWASFGAVCPKHGAMEVLIPEDPDPDEHLDENEELAAVS
jgi:hypothetical protein